MSEYLYVDNNGRVACIDHGGAYLKAAVQQSPRSVSHHTPITTWVRFPRAEAESEGFDCETCDRA